jgi:hypothetical protein
VKNKTNKCPAYARGNVRHAVRDGQHRQGEGGDLAKTVVVTKGDRETKVRVTRLGRPGAFGPPDRRVRLEAGDDVFCLVDEMARRPEPNGN